MAERLIVTGGDKVRALNAETLTETARISLTGSGAVCRAGNCLFVASVWGDVIWRLAADSLVPTALFAGGPGISRMMMTPEGQLLVLCADADSLMGMTADGAPQVVNRAGVNPRSMALDAQGRTVLVAGGACGEVLLYDAEKLTLLRALPMPGMVHDVVFFGQMLCALVMTETLDTLLCLVDTCGNTHALPLHGMPGAMAAGRGTLLCQAGGQLYSVRVETSRVERTWSAPGRAERLCRRDGTLLLLDGLTEGIWRMDGSGRWHSILENAVDWTE